jgi:hypothetical protein
MSLVSFLTLNFNYCWFTLPTGLYKTPSGTLDRNVVIPSFFSILQFRLTSGGPGERGASLLNVNQFTNAALFNFPLCLSEALEIVTKPVNYMEIHVE